MSNKMYPILMLNFEKPGTLRLLTHVELFSKTGSDTFRSVFVYGKD